MTTTTTEEREASKALDTAEAPHGLTAHDRCDRCGSQAYVRVELPTGELFFCGHHGRELAHAYSSVALRVHDETERLYAQHGPQLATAAAAAAS